jgi:hypothetical protein
MRREPLRSMKEGLKERRRAWRRKLLVDTHRSVMESSHERGSFVSAGASGLIRSFLSCAVL